MALREAPGKHAIHSPINPARKAKRPSPKIYANFRCTGGMLWKAWCEAVSEFIGSAEPRLGRYRILEQTAKLGDKDRELLYLQG